MSKKSRHRLEEEIEFLNKTLQEAQGIKRKTKNWTEHDLIALKPLTPPQEDMIYHFAEGRHIAAHGSAGTGKTLVAMFLALREVFNPDTNVNHVKIVRSAVPSKEQGFLPGTKEEKERIYELPYHDICSFLLKKKSSYDDLKKAGVIEFVTTSYVRGLTWDDTVVIIDEGQNLMFSEINSIITRLGRNSRLMFLGDKPQCDLYKKYEESGLEKFLKVIQKMDEIEEVIFQPCDIVRSKFVKSWIQASEGVE